MRLRNIRGSEEVIQNSPYVIQKVQEYKGKWSQVFGNHNPIHIEIGMGKGNFITTLAKNNPEINYIGIEKYTSVLLRAVQKIEVDPVANLRFICIDAKILGEVFAEEEISKIYLNFSDPWPKDRHAKRRLTSHLFLEKYDNIFKFKKEIIQKTDNINLFSYSISSLSTYGYTLDYVTLDL